MSDKLKFLQQSFINITATYLRTINAATNIIDKVHNLQQGIFDLVEGKLPPLLIKPKVLSKSIKEIQSILNRQYH